VQNSSSNNHGKKTMENLTMKTAGCSQILAKFYTFGNYT